MACAGFVFGNSPSKANFPALEKLVGNLMITTDPIADMLTQIRNAQMVHKEFVELPHSKMKEEIAKVLEKEGFIGEVRRFKPKETTQKMLHIDLKYDGKLGAIDFIKRISKPGKKIYEPKKKLGDYVKGTGGVVIVSTSKGIMTHKEAKKKGLGGEIICVVG